MTEIIVSVCLMQFGMKGRSNMNNNTTKRLGIYFFYDKDGIVDDYIPFYLLHLRNYCSEVCVVVNGVLTEAGKRKLESCCSKLIVRENIGFDAWAYKEALESYGFANIAKNFDEVLLNNFTVYGPIGSFEPMFKKMSSSVCDFWGHCRYYSFNGQKVCNVQIPEHLMSYFIVFKKSIISTYCFEDYFKTLKPIHNYDDARLNHEFRMTGYFEKLGFISDAYIPSENNVKMKGINTSVLDAYKQFVEYGSPLLKRKALFLQDGKVKWGSCIKFNSLIHAIYRAKAYDLKMCFTNLIRTGNFDYIEQKRNKMKLIRYFILGKIFRLKRYRKKIQIELEHIDTPFIEMIINQ